MLQAPSAAGVGWLCLILFAACIEAKSTWGCGRCHHSLDTSVHLWGWPRSLDPPNVFCGSLLPLTPPLWGRCPHRTLLSSPVSYQTLWGRNTYCKITFVRSPLIKTAPSPLPPQQGWCSVLGTWRKETEKQIFNKVTPVIIIIMSAAKIYWMFMVDSTRIVSFNPQDNSILSLFYTEWNWCSEKFNLLRVTQLMHVGRE